MHNINAGPGVFIFILLDAKYGHTEIIGIADGAKNL